MTTASMSSAEFATDQGVTKQTIWRWRQGGYGPAYFQAVPGGPIRYRVEDVINWENRLRDAE